MGLRASKAVTFKDLVQKNLHHHTKVSNLAPLRLPQQANVCHNHQTCAVAVKAIQIKRLPVPANIGQI